MGDHLHPDRVERVVGDEGAGAGARLDGDIEPGGDQLGRRVRNQSHPTLVMCEFSGGGNLHVLRTLRNGGPLLQARRILNPPPPKSK